MQAACSQYQQQLLREVKATPARPKYMARCLHALDMLTEVRVVDGQHVKMEELNTTLKSAWAKQMPDIKDQRFRFMVAVSLWILRSLF